MSETVHEAREALSGNELQELWALAPEARLEAFRLPRAEAEDFNLMRRIGFELLLALPAVERRGWMRLLAPDDAADDTGRPR